jgi:hypothetical protein
MEAKPECVPPARDSVLLVPKRARGTAGEAEERLDVGTAIATNGGEAEMNGSSGWIRTSNPPVNSRMLCR